MAGSFITNDLSIFTASSDFGEAVIWKGHSIDALFDDADTEVTTDSGDVMILEQPMITVSSALVIGLVHGDAVRARGKDYTVSHRMDDGTGMVEIYLEDAA